MWALLILTVLLVVVPLWALARTFRLKRQIARLSELDTLTRRVQELEKAVHALRDAMTGRAPPPTQGAQPATAEAKQSVTPQPARVAPSVAVTPPPAAPQPAPAATSSPATAMPPPPAIPPPPVVPPAAPAAAAPSAHTQTPFGHGITASGGAATAPPASPASYEERRRRWAGWEEKLTTNWMNKAGALLLVVGFAYLLNYSWDYLGAGVKIALGYALGAGLLGAGMAGERQERYRLISRAVIGAGWALVYFTTYALHNIDAVRLVESATAGFLMLFAVAAAMVVHSLRYDSEVVTGFAYLLAFASVAVSQKNLGALAAAALLAASLVVILRRREWYALEPPAIIALYALHYTWLSQVFNEIGGRQPFPGARASVALLTVYWLIFTASQYLRREGDQRQRLLLAASLLLNAGGYLWVLRYQSLYPELRFWFLLGMGAVYLGLAVLARGMGRRMGFVLASTLGATLAVVAIPYRYSGARLELLWLAEAQALLVAGWRAAEPHLRRLGWAALSVLVVYVLFHDIPQRLALTHPQPDWALGWMLLAIAVALLVNARYVPRLLGEGATQWDTTMGQVLTPVATALLLAAVWVSLPMMWTALVWAAIAAGLREAGLRGDDGILRFCGHAAAALAVLRLLVVNLHYAPPLYLLNQRLVTMAAAAALFYIVSRRLARMRPQGELPAALENISERLPAAYSWAGSALLTLLLWREVTTAGVGLAWALAGLALAEAGRALKDSPLHTQGLGMLALSFGRIFIADLNAEVMLGPVSARLVSVAPLALMYYYTAHTSPADRPRSRTAFYWMGTLALVALLRFEMLTEWVAVGWAALCTALYLAGRRLDQAALRHQSYLLAVLVGMRAALDNFFQVGEWWFTSVRTVTVLAAAALLYLLLPAALRAGGLAREVSVSWRSPGQALRGVAEWSDARAHYFFYFVPTILLTALIGAEVERWRTAAWAAEAFVLFLMALPLKVRAFRWFSLGLFVFCVARVVSVDVWGLEPLGRIVSLMALGAALLTVSFLYARNREAWRKYL